MSNMSTRLPAYLSRLASRLRLGASPDSTSRIDSLADLGQHVIGREYLGRWDKSWLDTPAQTLTAIMSGDSTMLGQGATASDFLPQNLLPLLCQNLGFKLTTTMSAFSGKTTADWINTYLPLDLAGPQPGIYILNWGMNDPSAGISVDQTVANLRAGFAAIRAAWPTCSVVYGGPNTACDDAGGRNEAWREAARPGMIQAARDYGVCFFDTYSALREARYNVDALWLDAAGVHPNNRHYLAIWDRIANVLFPTSLQAFQRKPALVTLKSGYYNPTPDADKLKSFQNGSGMVGFTGWAFTDSTTVASGTNIFTLPAQHRPSSQYRFLVPVSFWNGTGGGVSTNWEQVPCVVGTNGVVTTMKASTISVLRFHLDGVFFAK